MKSVAGPLCRLAIVQQRTAPASLHRRAPLPEFLELQNTPQPIRTPEVSRWVTRGRRFIPLASVRHCSSTRAVVANRGMWPPNALLTHLPWTRVKTTRWCSAGACRTGRYAAAAPPDESESRFGCDTARNHPRQVPLSKVLITPREPRGCDPGQSLCHVLGTRCLAAR